MEMDINSNIPKTKCDEFITIIHSTSKLSSNPNRAKLPDIKNIVIRTWFGIKLNPNLDPQLEILNPNNIPNRQQRRSMEHPHIKLNNII